jgi:hypothetical protein
MTSTMRFDKWENSLGQPYGTVLQVKSAAKTDTFVTSSQTYTTATGLTATITPFSTSSKVLITAQISFAPADPIGNNGLGFFKVTRGGTDIYIGDAGNNRVRTVFGGRNTLNRNITLESGFIQFLDSPSSTSALTYQVEVRGVDGASVYINRSSDDQDINNRPRGASSITVMEIAQ